MTIRNRKSERGAALLMAISLLALFMYMGSEYVRYMLLEVSTVEISENRARARSIAAAGVQAALGDLGMVLEPDAGSTKVLGRKEYPFNTYRTPQTGEARLPVPDPDRVARADVVISDETRKLNLNSAPAAALMRVLKVDEQTAQKIVQSRGPRRWFLSVDDLRTRGLLTEGQFAAVALEKLTTFPAGEAAGPCFKIVSDSTVAKKVNGEEYEAVHAHVSAVVVFGDDGDYEVVYWNTQKRPDSDA